MQSPHKLPVKAAVTALVLGLPAAFLTTAGPSAATPSLPSGDAQALPAVELNLGAQDLPEARDVTELAPGLTRTSITRGTPNPSLFGRLKWPSRRIHPTFGPDLVNRETTSQLAAADGALAGINGGYFVLDPKGRRPRRATTRQGRQGCTAGPGRR